jgi:hypothetical protein
MKNVNIDENYYLVSKQVNANDVVEIDKSINHIVVVDCSGSMYGELPKIRTQLKNKLPSLMRDGDTISIIWFSGTNDAGILKEEVEVRSLKTLDDLNKAIDRWLVADCLTAFLKPLQLTKELIGRVKKNRPDSLFSLLFLTDGYNNACNFNDVLKTLETLKTEISASIMVEYGYYADSQKLTQMAAILGGEKISCDGFDDYELTFDARLSSSITSGKKISVDVPSSLYDFAFSCDNRQILLYNIQDGKVLVNENLTNIYFFNNNATGTELVIDENIQTALYAAVYVLSDKLMNDDAEKLFYLIKDNYYYRMLVNAFGKQKLNAFKSSIRECVSDLSKRYPEGSADIKKLPDDAFCLMNLMGELSDSDLKFYPNHEDFNYNRIGRKKVAVGDKLNESDQTKLASAKTVAEMVEIAKELEENKINTEFVNTDPNRGYGLRDLVWNEERANLSLRIKIDGSVKLPKNKFGIDEVSSYKYNTFTLLKDGILNVTLLPIDYNLQFIVDVLIPNRVNFETKDDVCIIDLSSLPIINKQMIKSISANDLAKLEWELLKLQADAKVYGDYRKTMFPKTSKSFVDMLGQDCADWLKEIGITDFNGYTPKSEFAESKDFYMSVNLITKLKGISSLPKVSDVIAKLGLTNPVLKPAEWLMSKAIKEIQPKLADKDLEDFIINQTNLAVSRKRAVMQKIAEIKFSLILSKKWFTEFKSFDENKLSVVLDGQNLEFTFDLCEKEIKI